MKLLSSTFEQLSSGSFDRLFLCCICWLKKYLDMFFWKVLLVQVCFYFLDFPICWFSYHPIICLNLLIFSMREWFFCSSIKNSCSIQISNFSVSLFGILLSQRISLACVSFVHLVMIHPFISAIFHH